MAGLASASEIEQVGCRGSFMMSAVEPTLSAPAPAQVSSSAVFGRVMALVALTVGFAAAGM